ncbi:hypothetical protein SAMN05216337_1007112 [Bradyrhizobium brasilense]|uniref:Uncharacterized protein n=1 Tax=Bradyrhizobium brasilense TaxID=1419277 RepID=A0A1G6RT56_9BRAD|nr:hypothetical protein [Bradyrhizobium brasilense]SDD07613.1 hypothetical protein SAMN05216337_1007112 [Bradyrhizobium brasilense]
MSEPTQSIHDRIMSVRRATGGGRDAFADEDEIVPRRRWLRNALYGVSAVVALSVSGFGLYQIPVVAESFAQVTGKPKTTPQPRARAAQKDNLGTSAATPAAAAAATDPFLTHASQAGVKACALTYSGLGKSLTNGTEFMVQTQTAKTDADRRGLEGVVGMTFPSGRGDYSGAAAGVVFAAPTAQGCEGNMVRVVPFVQNCQAAAGFLPKGSQPLQPLSGLAVYALSTGGQAMLMPSGNGCVVVSILRTGG